jgi:hypothetical protein
MAEKTKDDIITELIDVEWFDTYSTRGLTYGEIRDLDYQAQELERISYEQMAYEEMLADCR